MSVLERPFVIRALTQEEIIEEIRLIASRIAPDWDFDDDSDIGRFLSDIAAALSERGNVFSNLVANQAFIQTATDQFYVSLLAHYQRYRVRTAQPTRVSITITLNQTHPSAITIEPYTMKVVNKDSQPRRIVFENEEQIIIPANTLSIDAIFIEGETREVQFTSDGLEHQHYDLPNKDIILWEYPTGGWSEWGINITTDDFDPDDWKLVSHFAFQGAGDAPYMLIPRLDGTTKLAFSDGELGAMPEFGHTITVKYRYGGGNTILPAFKVNDTYLSPPLPGGINISKVENPETSYGGAARADIETVRRGVPLLGSRDIALLKTEQLEFVANEVAGVARAKIIPIGLDIYGTIVPVGFGQPTQELLDDVNETIRYRLGIGYNFLAVPPVYRGIETLIEIWLAPTTSREAADNEIRNLVNRRMNGLAVNDAGKFINDFGGVLTREELALLIKNESKMVYDYKVHQPSLDIAMNPEEIITDKRIRPRLTLTGHASGIDIFVQAATESVIGSKVQIEINPVGFVASNVTVTDELALFNQIRSVSGCL